MKFPTHFGFCFRRFGDIFVIICMYDHLHQKNDDLFILGSVHQILQLLGRHLQVSWKSKLPLLNKILDWCESRSVQRLK